MPRHTPIPRVEALALLAEARDMHPPGEAVSFMPSAKQVRAARAALGRSVDNVATLTGLPPAAVENVEAGVNTARDDVAKLEWLLEALGATFVRKGVLQAVVFRV